MWDTEADVWGQEAFDLFTYCRRTFGSLAAWDGPAGIIGTDGRMLVGLVDRMGLRPVRWCSDKRGWLYIGSESGVFGLDTTTIVASGQLQPGQMIALDTATGERLDSHQIMARVVAEAKAELGDVHELNRRQIVIPEGFDFTRQTDDIVGAMLAERNWTLDHLLQAAGWDFDRAVFVKDMAKLQEGAALESMGHDRVLTVFSQHHPTLFKYLQQTFAEVTNPPIDPYREGGAMSLTTYLGRSAADGRPAVLATGDDELPVKQMELPSPVVSDAIIEEIRQNEVLGFKLLDATFPLSGGAEALRDEPASHSQATPRRPSTTATTSCASRDKEACKRGIDPIPSLLALGAVHTLPVPAGAARPVQPDRAGRRHSGRARRLLPRRVRGRRRSPVPDAAARQGRADVQGPGDQAGVSGSTPARRWRTCSRPSKTRIKKIISKMGITTIEGYRGAMLFEAVGFGPELMEFLGDFPSRLGGIGLDGLVEDAQWRVQQAEKMTRARPQPRLHGLQREGPDGPARRGEGSPPRAGARAAARWPTPPRRQSTTRTPPSASADKFVKFTDMVNDPRADRAARPVQRASRAARRAASTRCSRPSTSSATTSAARR